MYLEIVSPETTLFSGEVKSVAVPGVSGEFEMLNNHAPIVSTLKQGKVKIYGDIELKPAVKSRFTTGEKGSVELLIASGTLEMKDNKVIILAD